MHNWTLNPDETEAVCSKCEWHVTCSDDEETAKGSRIDPSKKTIFTCQSRIKVSDCEYLAKVWGVKCT